MLAVADFLNAREKATIIWGALLLIYVWRKDHSIGWSFLSVFRAMVHPKLLSIWVATAIYTAALVFAAYTAHLWHTTALKETLYWLVATGAVLAGGATTAQFDRAYARRLARKALRFTLVVEFLVGVYVLPLGVELVLVPLVALFVGMQAVSENDPKLASVKKVLDRVLVIIGLSGMTWVLVEALTDLRGLLTREHAERLLLAPTFTLAFIPFLYGICRLSQWDQERTMRRWRESSAAA